MNFFEQIQKELTKSIFSDEVLSAVQENTMPFESLMSQYKCAIMEVETKFKVLNEQFSLQYDRNPIETIKTRLKSREGIMQKLVRKDLPISLESIEKNINDVAGVRVVCSFPEDIYMLADCLLAQDDITLIEKRDYIKNPKESGYRSLHLIVSVPIFLKDEKKDVKVEVQLRTIAMDFWASIEHKLRYKKHIDEDEAQVLARELVECSEISAALDKRMEEIKNRIAKVQAEKN